MYEYRITGDQADVLPLRALARGAACTEVPGEPGEKPSRAMITLSTCATPEDDAAGNFWRDAAAQSGAPHRQDRRPGVLQAVMSRRACRRAVPATAPSPGSMTYALPSSLTRTPGRSESGTAIRRRSARRRRSTSQWRRKRSRIRNFDSWGSGAGSSHRASSRVSRPVMPALDEVEGAGHRAEVDALLRGAALDVGDVADQRLLAVRPGVVAADALASTQAWTRALSVEPWLVRPQVVVDGRAARCRRRARWPSRRKSAASSPGREEVAEHQHVGLLGRLVAVDACRPPPPGSGRAAGCRRTACR